MSAMDPESYQRLFFELAEDGMLLADAREKIADANPVACRLLGKERERLVGSALGTVFDPSYPFLEVAREAGGGTFKGAVRLMRDDGSPFPAEVSIVEGADGAPRGVVFRDLTEGRRTEEALKQSEERFEALVENGLDLITPCSPDNTIRYISPSVKRILGYQPEELVGVFVPGLLHPDDLHYAIEKTAAILADPERKPNPVRYRRRDGSWCLLETVFNNLLSDPSVRGILCNSRDATERILAEEALRESENRLRLALEATGLGTWDFDVNG